MVALHRWVACAATSGAAPTAEPLGVQTSANNKPRTDERYYKSYHYSPLDQINTSNVANLGVAWIHIPGRSTRGLQSMPIAADGVLYYTGSYSRTFALNGATGEVIWSYFPELDEALIARQTH